jgi:ABC-type transport system involved in cytochrome c biogenesis permease subunit
LNIARTWRTKRKDLATPSLIAIGGGFAVQTAALLLRAYQVGGIPITGRAQEAFSFLGWALVLYYLITYSQYKTQALTAFILPLVFGFTLAATVLPIDNNVPAQTALQLRSITGSPLFIFHIILIMFSYAAFFVTFASGIMYLVQERELKLKRFGSFFFRLPSLTTCDEISYRSLSIGFVLLTIALAFGVYMNSQRDSKLWHNDPKEIIAVITWLLYLILMHYRLTERWRGHRAAIISIVGFGLILFSLIGIRFLGGYHVFG